MTIQIDLLKNIEEVLLDRTKKRLFTPYRFAVRPTPCQSVFSIEEEIAFSIVHSVEATYIDYYTWQVKLESDIVEFRFI